MPDVTIIVPCYNQGPFLAECLASVQAQDFQHWECIVIDDGSRDDSVRVAESFRASDPRFLVLTQPNRGVSVTRNRGLDAASGRYVQFLDADDVIAPNKLGAQLAVFAARPDADVVFCDFTYFSDDASRQERASPKSFRDKARADDVLVALLTGNFIVIHAALVRREAVARIGGFDTSLVGCEDFDFWLRLAAAGCRFVWMPEPLVKYREHPSSASRNAAKMCETMLSVLMRVPRYAPRLEPPQQWVWRMAVAGACRQVAGFFRGGGSAYRSLALRLVALTFPIIARSPVGLRAELSLLRAIHPALASTR